MRLVLGLIALLCAAPAHAASLWDYNGSTFLLVGDDAAREFTYDTVKAGLPVSKGATFFKGTASGNHYSGTAYVFAPRCGAMGFSVTGAVNVDGSIIVLSGKAPRRDNNCKVIDYADTEMQFSFTGCDGCTCDPMDTPELRPVFKEAGDPMYGEKTASEEGEGTSCPYLYAWNGQDSKWDSYGKVIRDARGQRREMTQVIKLSKFATNFRLSEEEWERSFIDQVRLRLDLNDGAWVVLEPTAQTSAEQNNKRIYIPAFKAVEFSFELPSGIKPTDVAQAWLSIKGYYESLPPSISRPPVISQGPKVCRASNACRALTAASGKRALHGLNVGKLSIVSILSRQ
jgi:hypothetical protein